MTTFWAILVRVTYNKVMASTLSVVIITKNEEERIGVCLESIKWANEIIVADNGSSDRTVEIAKEFTNKVFKFNGLTFDEIRNKATEKTTGKWILYIDADERVLAPLREEIKQIINSAKYDAFAISRRNIIFGEEVRYGPFFPDWVIRLVKKENYQGWIGKVHEYLKFKGELGYTTNSMLHLTHRNVDQVILKTLDYSKIDSKLRLDASHPKMSSWRFLRIFITETLNQGFKRKGFFNGTVGVIDSLLQTFSMVITYIRLWELQQKIPLQKKYQDIDQKLIEDDFQL